MALALAAFAGHVPASASASAAALAPAPPVRDKSAHSLLNPTPRDQRRDMSTDRPDTTESPYTVDAGCVQIECSLVDLSRDRHAAAARSTRFMSIAPVLIKVGLLHNADIQFGVQPYTRESTADQSRGHVAAIDRLGDATVRLKVNLWGNDAGATALALMPYVKVPTSGGDDESGRVEGGLIVPFALALPGEFSLGFMAQADIVRDPEDDRYILDLAHTATLGRPIWKDLAGYVEYAGFADLSGGQDYRGYFDTGLTFALSSDIQLDAGIRVGLTPAADDLGGFCGISFRF